MPSNIRQGISTAFKIVFFLVCLGLSILSTLEIIKLYIAGDTTISSGSTGHEVADSPGSPNLRNSYHMPTFVLCAEKPYKDNTKLLYTLQEFEENTIDPREHLFSFSLMKFNENEVSKK